MGVRNIIWQQYNLTVINPFGILLTIVMCIAVLTVKREYVIIPFLIIACFITSMQRIVIADLDFTMLRIMVGFGILRLFIKHDIKQMKFNSIDKAMIFWIVSRTITHTLLWQRSADFIEATGFLVDTMGMYFVFRKIFYDFNDFNIIIKTLAVLSIIVAFFMIIEQFTGRNLFSVFGGVPEFTVIRKGRLRSQGAFSHAIMAGTFGASLIPMMWALWYQNYKKYAAIGLLGGTIITITSASSGPVMTLLACFFGLFLWRYRVFTKFFLWSSFILTIILHLIMEAPVWHLISRIDIAGGSTGYHRFTLIDQTIKRFSEWFLVGCKTPEFWGWGMQDLTNMFVFEAVFGGILPVIFFTAIIVSCFKTVGFARQNLMNDINFQKYVWALGAVLFAHTVSFIGVAYFGQMLFFFFLLIAMISTLRDFPAINRLT